MGEINKAAFCVALGKNISKIRRSRGITLEKLAYEMGISKGNLSDIENGKIDPRASTLYLIAKGLGTPINKILTGISTE